MIRWVLRHPQDVAIVTAALWIVGWMVYAVVRYGG